jgi:threonine/homoserine/homoserine lactone efflux protein
MSRVRVALIAFLTGFSGAIMPGPMLALVIGAVGAQGFLAVPAIVGGHALLELVTVLGLIAGLGVALRRTGLRAGLGLVGGLGLLWMGLEMVRHASEAALPVTGSGTAQPWWVLVFWGAAVCAANPYFVGWWATIGAGQMAHLALRSRRDYLSFYLGHELSDAVWYALVGIIVASGRRLLGPEVYRGLVVSCGAALLLLAGWFLWTGLRLLLHPPTPEAAPPAPAA